MLLAYPENLRYQLLFSARVRVTRKTAPFGVLMPRQASPDKPEIRFIAPALYYRYGIKEKVFVLATSSYPSQEGFWVFRNKSNSGMLKYLTFAAPKKRIRAEYVLSQYFQLISLENAPVPGNLTR